MAGLAQPSTSGVIARARRLAGFGFLREGFAGSLRAGERAANIMRVISSCRECIRRRQCSDCRRACGRGDAVSKRGLGFVDVI
jgi:hypothetical protein